MTNRFEQSAPPSIDRIYKNLPIGPFGVSPYVYPRRHRGTDGKTGVRRLARRLAGLMKAMRSALQRWIAGKRAYADIALPTRRAACTRRP